MRRLFLYLLTFSVITSLFTLQSCKDNDYDWDKMNTNGVIHIPPVPIGSLDTIWVNTLIELPNIPPIELPGDGATIAYSYDIKNLFSEDAIEKIFYDGAGNVSIEGFTDILVLNSTSNLRIGMKFHVLDEQYKIINAIKIPDQNSLKYGKDQPINILFESQYMKHFENAAHLRLEIVMKANTITVNSKDYILLKKLIAKTGGIHVEL